MRRLSEKEKELLISLFEDIALQEGWKPEGQLQAHRDRSTYFAAYIGGTLAGGMQVVAPDPSGILPFHAVWPEAEVGVPCRTVHVPVLAVRPEFRGPLRLFWPLCVELWRFCAVSNLESIVIEATPAMLARYRRIGWNLKVIGELRMHWGEECYLCQADVQAVAGVILARALGSPTFRSLVSQAIRPVGNPDCAAVAALA